MDTAKLVIQCQSGDREAFGLLYNLHAHSMMKCIGGYIKNHDVAQDILHDGFIIAFSALADLKSPARFESWLATIMRNLSLQYLREAANRKMLPLTDTPSEYLLEDDTVGSGLSWDELNGIIDRLPDGYNKVFRLAVLDKLTHKEIGKMLGIAPHSSSSQLSHAKAMLRRLITEYRIESIGILIIVFSVLMICLEPNRRYENDNGNPTTNGSNNRGQHRENEAASAQSPTVEKEDTTKQSVKIKLKKETQEKEFIAKAKLPGDTTSIVPENKQTEDSISNFSKTTVIEDNESLTYNDVPINEEDNQNSWSIALAYNGNMGQNTDNHYRIPGGPEPDLPSGEPDKIDMTEKSVHHMPITIGFSLSHGLSSRWSVESGIRYTLLRSDFMRESEIEKTEINQRIHYVGIPLKFNYRILGNHRFSIYGQGGISLDIPVHGKQSITKWEQGWNKPEFDRLTISAPLQWSVGGGIGLQYHMTLSLSIYAEPSFLYYFDSGTEIKTLRNDKPFEFTIPVGIRIDW